MLIKLKKVAKNSRVAFEKQIDSKKKDMVLKRFSSLLYINKKKIIKANIRDIKFARKKKSKGKFN